MSTKQVALVTYTRGEYAGMTIISLLEDRDGRLWAKPRNAEYNKIANRNAIGYVPLADRTDWAGFGYLSE